MDNEEIGEVLKKIYEKYENGFDPYEIPLLGTMFGELKKELREVNERGTGK